MRVVVVVMVVLDSGCAPRVQQVPAGAPAAAADPQPPELAALQEAFRKQDREIGDRLASSERLDCYQLEPLHDELGRLMGKICQLTNTREGGRYRPSVSCRYAQQRSIKLNREAGRRGCVDRRNFFDPGFPNG